MPRRAARHFERLLAAGGQRLQEAVLDLVEPSALADRAAVALEHAVSVEARLRERHDARVDDREAELVEHGCRAGERARFFRRVHGDGRQARHHDVVDVDGDRARAAALDEHARVPRDLLGAVAQEVLLGEARPNRLVARALEAALREQLLGLGQPARDELVLVDRVRHAAAQRAARRVVELREQRLSSRSSRSSDSCRVRRPPSIHRDSRGAFGRRRSARTR